ncbi:hypothetical protein FQZ97_1183180 [compost metagenome]
MHLGLQEGAQFGKTRGLGFVGQGALLRGFAGDAAHFHHVRRLLEDERSEKHHEHQCQHAQQHQAQRCLHLGETEIQRGGLQDLGEVERHESGDQQDEDNEEQGAEFHEGSFARARWQEIGVASVLSEPASS